MFSLDCNGCLNIRFAFDGVNAGEVVIAFFEKVKVGKEAHVQEEI